MSSLAEFLHRAGGDVLDAMVDWSADNGRALYPHQESAILELLSGSNVILATPTGSGKSMVALAAHAQATLPGAGRSWYTAPVKALVTEKFFELCAQLGPEHVGMMTGDSSFNSDAPVMCCTTEILAFMALRDGSLTDADTVVLDEFHFYADPDRGWAWQVPLLEMTRATFLLLSATLGDTRFLADDLTRRTGRPTAVIADAVRPVPLRYEYRYERLHHVVEELVQADAAPLYLVNFTQADAVEQANSLASVVKLGTEAKALVAAELARAPMPPGFGRDLARLLRNGVGVHHAGMLPRHRRLVERLTQLGALKVVSGTDTLGVGVNLPIRTVVFTRLYKFDGTGNRMLSAREFHQIAGRAGRAGYDTEGLVVALAPDHEAEYLSRMAKAGTDTKKQRKATKPPTPRGYVHYDSATFAALQIATPEKLESSFAVTPAMMLHLLDRPADTWTTVRALLLDNHEPRSRQRRHVRRAIGLYRSLLASRVVERLDTPLPDGRRVRVDRSLQQDFALNQPLAPFLLDLLPQLDTDDDGHVFALLAAVESVLDDPRQVLFAQREKAKTEAMTAMKAAGIEYEERIERLEKVTSPKPMAEEIYGAFDEWRLTHRWIDGANVSPKGVVRDIWERAMDFPSYVRHYGLKRSEGTLLRYLSDAYRTITRTIPEDLQTDDISEIADWLDGVIRATDSSLIDEWQALRDDAPPQRAASAAVADPADFVRRPAALKALIRNRVFRWVQLAAGKRWDALHEDLVEAGDHARNSEDLAALFGPYFTEHASIGIDSDARGPHRFEVVVDGGGRRWTVHQTLADPEGFDEWQLTLEFDLDATERDAELRGRLVTLARL
ncbi:MAG: box helicase domain protein [Ilumatobacteraceae bacterium]|nr:box helicase domain protein [Ilumatobacteraceae bacterium]